MLERLKEAQQSASETLDNFLKIAKEGEDIRENVEDVLEIVDTVGRDESHPEKNIEFLNDTKTIFEQFITISKMGGKDYLKNLDIDDSIKVAMAEACKNACAASVASARQILSNPPLESGPDRKKLIQDLNILITSLKTPTDANLKELTKIATPKRGDSRETKICKAYWNTLGCMLSLLLTTAKIIVLASAVNPLGVLKNLMVFAKELNDFKTSIQVLWKAIKQPKKQTRAEQLLKAGIAASEKGLLGRLVGWGNKVVKYCSDVVEERLSRTIQKLYDRTRDNTVQLTLGEAFVNLKTMTPEQELYNQELVTQDNEKNKNNETQTTYDDMKASATKFKKLDSEGIESVLDTKLSRYDNLVEKYESVYKIVQPIAETYNQNKAYESNSPDYQKIHSAEEKGSQKIHSPEEAGKEQKIHSAEKAGKEKFSINTETAFFNRKGKKEENSAPKPPHNRTHHRRGSF